MLKTYDVNTSLRLKGVFSDRNINKYTHLSLSFYTQINRSVKDAMIRPTRGYVSHVHNNNLDSCIFNIDVSLGDETSLTNTTCMSRSWEI
jgi:hypothetical protein